MAHLKNIILSERSQTQTSTIEWFHFYKILERQSHINWEQISRFQEPNEEEETDHKASQRKFPSEGDVLCHDYGGGSWLYQFSSVQSLCRVWLFAIPWTAARQATLSITTPKVHPNSCALSQWCCPTISPSVISFSSCPQSFPASGSFPMSQPFVSGGQSIRISASASVLTMNTQGWSPLEWTGTLKSLLQHHSSKASILLCSAFFIFQLSHPYRPLGKPYICENSLFHTLKIGEFNCISSMPQETWFF